VPALNIIFRVSITCAWLLLSLVYRANADTLPVSAPIRFGSDKAVEIDATLDRHRNYSINLAIHFNNDQERAFARLLIGDQAPICRVLKDCGEAASFKVTIRTNDTVLFEQVKQSYGHFSFSAGAYYRNILITPLKPGKYKFRVEVVDFGPTMPRADTSIELSTDSRERDFGD